MIKKDPRDMLNVDGFPKGDKERLIYLFKAVRDIPYGSIGSRDPNKVYEANKGTCSGKHALLKLLLEQIGLDVKDKICVHCFNDLPIDFPEKINTFLQNHEIFDPHNYLQVFLNGVWLDLDVTWDSPLARYGFETNDGWNAKTDAHLCVSLLEDYDVDDPVTEKISIIQALPKSMQKAREEFLYLLTEWLEEIRKKDSDVCI